MKKDASTLETSFGISMVCCCDVFAIGAITTTQDTRAGAADGRLSIGFNAGFAGSS